jgi:hypothetical protein
MKQSRTLFLNVDLELVSSSDLGPLIAAFGRGVIILRDTTERRRRTVWLELARQPRTIDQAFSGYAELASKLPRAARLLWKGCSDRCLNVGIQSGLEPAAYFEISRAGVAIAATMDARIVVTVYGADVAPPPKRRMRRVS